METINHCVITHHNIVWSLLETTKHQDIEQSLADLRVPLAWMLDLTYDVRGYSVHPIRAQFEYLYFLES